jgi:bacterioferritin-associated ferredoxin
MSEIICYCKNVSKQEIETAINNGAKTLNDIKRITNACTGNDCKTTNPKGVCCSVDIIPLLPDNKQKCNCCCDNK